MLGFSTIKKLAAEINNGNNAVMVNMVRGETISNRDPEK